MTRWSVGTDEIGSHPNEDDCFILDENNASITDEIGNFKRPIAEQIVRDHTRAEAFEAMRIKLADVLEDFESGYIANSSVRAEKRREAHIVSIKAALALADAAEKAP